jgi:hypothetical protein
MCKGMCSIDSRIPGHAPASWMLPSALRRCLWGCMEAGSKGPPASDNTHVSRARARSLEGSHARALLHVDVRGRLQHRESLWCEQFIVVFKEPDFHFLPPRMPLYLSLARLERVNRWAAPSLVGYCLRLGRSKRTRPVENWAIELTLSRSSSLLC